MKKCRSLSPAGEGGEAGWGSMKIMHEIKLSTQRARRLRKNMTEAERKLWGKLRGQQLGFRFRRQVVLGRYIVDFTCLDPKSSLRWMDHSMLITCIMTNREQSGWNLWVIVY